MLTFWLRHLCFYRLCVKKKKKKTIIIEVLVLYKGCCFTMMCNVWFHSMSVFRPCCPPGAGSTRCWTTPTWWWAATCPVSCRERRRVTSSASYWTCWSSTQALRSTTRRATPWQRRRWPRSTTTESHHCRYMYTVLPRMDGWVTLFCLVVYLTCPHHKLFYIIQIVDRHQFWTSFAHLSIKDRRKFT